MIKPRHNQLSFFKYYTAESANKTLFQTRLKWSSPKLFNDPFDNQFDIQFELSSKESMYNQEIHQILSDRCMFCVSETHDNILMWSHYADDHKGAVIEFHAQLEDSAFLVAQRVRYESTIPIFTHEMMKELQADGLFDMITLTKSKDWEYEKEWRVVTTMRDKSKDCEILRFPPEEVAAIYLGCRTTDECKREIIEIMNDKYPDAKIYQGRKHEREFSLVFDPV